MSPCGVQGRATPDNVENMDRETRHLGCISGIFNFSLPRQPRSFILPWSVLNRVTNEQQRKNYERVGFSSFKIDKTNPLVVFSLLFFFVVVVLFCFFITVDYTYYLKQQDLDCGRSCISFTK